MAIAFDFGSTGTASATSVTVAHTVSGSDRILLTGVTTGDGSSQGDDVVTGVTYNGVSMTRINTVVNTGNTSRSYLYYLLAPATGTNNVVASLSTSRRVRASSASYTGVGNGQPDASNTATDSSNPYSISVTTVADNCWVVGFDGNGAGEAITAGTSTTARGGSGTTGMIGDNNAAKTPAGSVTLNFASTDGFPNALVAASISPGTQVSGPTNMKTWDGVTSANIKTMDGVALASVKTWNGIA